MGVSLHDSPFIPHLLFLPSLSDSVCSGETDEGVLVPEPLRQADSAAHQENPGQDSQLPGEGQGVVRGRGASEAAARCQGVGLEKSPGFVQREGGGRTEDQRKRVIQVSSSLILLLLSHFLCGRLPPTSLSLTRSPHRHLELSCLNKPAFATGHKTSRQCLRTDLNCRLLPSVKNMDGIL